MLVEKLDIKGKHKIADKWEAEPYSVMDQPISDVLVLNVKGEDGQGRLRKLLRNQLFSFSGLPAPIVKWMIMVMIQMGNLTQIVPS